MKWDYSLLLFPRSTVENNLVLDLAPGASHFEVSIVLEGLDFLELDGLH